MKHNESLTALPDRLHRLRDLAFDLSWSWNPQAREVFRRIDYPLWRSTAHNPVRMLSMLPRQRLEQAAQESSFLAVYDAAIQGLDRARLAAGGESASRARGEGAAGTHSATRSVSLTRERVAQIVEHFKY